ncbi:uncharacterized protein LOC107268608 isoform X2 [Cephus cinctus]|uniref:Uncharacterized protein LOC107268608 isoform X2 n=1 Tax=Cephus cinctus TaxID=211228 RepID=A0AAJ7RK04_CEPCN|nr:uncharacterized protein LOC107268608 isoform X2 [Cephus cinctus]
MPEDVYLLSRSHKHRMITAELARYESPLKKSGFDETNADLHESCDLSEEHVFQAGNLENSLSCEQIEIEESQDLCASSEFSFEIDGNSIGGNLDDNADTLSDIKFEEGLRSWISKNNICHSAANELLKLLKHNGHSHLSADIRTFLRTPKLDSQTIESVNGGQYVHFNLSSSIERLITKYFQDIPSELKLHINVDGLPVSKSSGSQFWVILASIVADFHTEPFVVGFHHGLMKPKDPNQFLKFLVDDAKIISER